jgi:hypothetical protein
LAALREKQVLDEDPLTKVKTFVAKVNKNSVEIVSFNAAGGVDTEYDKQTGLATSISILNRVSGYELKMQLQARE